MATHWFIKTNAPSTELLQTFCEVFLARPSPAERLKLSKGAQLRSQQVWERASVAESDVAARLVRGGIREAIADSKRGPGSGLGTTIAMSADENSDFTVGQLWLANFNTYFWVINQQGDLLKAYSRLIATKLEERGYLAEALKSDPVADDGPAGARTLAASGNTTQITIPTWVWKSAAAFAALTVLSNILNEMEQDLSESAATKVVVVLGLLAIAIAIAAARSNNQPGTKPPSGSATF